MHHSVKWMASSALIAAMYALLTFAVAPIAFGPVQFRISEMLTVLPLFTFAAVPGLTVGCFLANGLGLFMGQTVVWDLLFGTAATLLAALISYLVGKRFGKKMQCVLGPLSPVVCNFLIVGAEIALFFTQGAATLTVFLFGVATVFLGEVIVCYGLGVPLIFLLYKNNLYQKVFVDTRL